MPVWAAMLAWPVLGERPTLRTMALVMAFAGLAPILGGNGWRQRGQMPGIIMALAGAIGFALGAVLAKLRAKTAAGDGGGLADRHRLLSGGDRGMFGARSRQGHAARLGAGVLRHRQSSSASPMSAGLQHWRGCGLGAAIGTMAVPVIGVVAQPCPARAARPRPDRGAGADARRRGAGDAVCRLSLTNE